MKNKVFVLFANFLIVILILNTFSIKASDIYVSPNGDDANSGAKENPLKSLAHASEKALQILQDSALSEIRVWMADGVYFLSEPLVLPSFIAASPDASVFFKAEKDAHPVVSGGMEISDWKKNNQGFWEATLDNTFIPLNQIRELFINDKRAVRARFPNKNYLRVKKVGEDRRTNFMFNEGDFPIPQNLDEVELVLLHDWSISRIGIKEINTNKSRLTAVDSIGAKFPAFFNLDHWEPNPRYFLENAPEFIDEDYEWVYYKAQKKILLKLPESENPENYKIVIPVSEGLLSLEGKENLPVKNIHFEGISFRHSLWEIPEKGYCGVQACHFDPRPEINGWNVVPAAINARWTENCSFDNCRVENIGGSGIWLGTGCKNCSIVNSEFVDISGNGIMIGEGQDREVNDEKWWKKAPGQVALGNVIENCRISDCGKQFYGSVGIWCGLVAETNIRKNQIFDLPYSGISIGWMWSPVPTPCRQNTIDGNHIHHIMQILSDGGGIYSLGLQPGSKLINNCIHDVEINAGRAESNGMFLDEGTTDVVVANNLIYNIAKSPLRFHRATTNLVTNNYLFCQNENPPIRYNTTNEKDIRKVENKVFAEGDEKYIDELKKAISAWEINNLNN